MHACWTLITTVMSYHAGLGVAVPALTSRDTQLIQAVVKGVHAQNCGTSFPHTHFRTDPPRCACANWSGA